jgi:hypothetical protein
VILTQDKEDQEFWANFNSPKKTTYGGSLYHQILEWDRLFVDLSVAKKAVKGVSIVKQMDEYKDQVDQEKFYKAKLYQYPEHG